MGSDRLPLRSLRDRADTLRDRLNPAFDHAEPLQARIGTSLGGSGPVPGYFDYQVGDEVFPVAVLGNGPPSEGQQGLIVRSGGRWVTMGGYAMGGYGDGCGPCSPAGSTYRLTFRYSAHGAPWLFAGDPPSESRWEQDTIIPLRAASTRPSHLRIPASAWNWRDPSLARPTIPPLRPDFGLDPYWFNTHYWRAWGGGPQQDGVMDQLGFRFNAFQPLYGAALGSSILSHEWTLACGGGAIWMVHLRSDFLGGHHPTAYDTYVFATLRRGTVESCDPLLITFGAQPDAWVNRPPVVGSGSPSYAPVVYAQADPGGDRNYYGLPGSGFRFDTLDRLAVPFGEIAFTVTES